MNFLKFIINKKIILSAEKIFNTNFVKVVNLKLFIYYIDNYQYLDKYFYFFLK